MELVEELLKRVPENSNKSEEPDVSQAVVHVDAGALSTLGPPKGWSLAQSGELLFDARNEAGPIVTVEKLILIAE